MQYKNKKMQPQQRLLDLKLLNLSGQLVILLSQNKLNESFSLDINFDKSVDVKYQVQDEKVKNKRKKKLILSNFIIFFNSFVD
jgi:hypothetical protein